MKILLVAPGPRHSTSDVYRYQHLDVPSIVDACGRALSETALENLVVSPALLEGIADRSRPARRDWRELWPERS